jgi:ribosome biogenesis SPOUT family RNA methylase Rps3
MNTFFKLAFTVLLFACSSVFADDEPTVTAPTEEQKIAAAKAMKRIDERIEKYKHWMYDEYDLTQKDELAGKSYPTKKFLAVLFSKHKDDEKYIVMHVEGTVSTKKSLNEKTSIWLDLESVPAVTPEDNKPYCTEQSCLLRIRFDDRPVVLIGGIMTDKQMQIPNPWSVIQEMKRSKIAKFEVLSLDDDGDPKKTIYTFEVKGFKWNAKN